MRRIGRRSDDMLIIRGVNVFPSQIEAALLEVEGTLPHYQIILTREHGLDQMEVQVEVTARDVQRPDRRAGTAARAAVRLRSSTCCGMRAQITLVEPHTIPAQRRQSQARDRPGGAS